MEKQQHILIIAYKHDMSYQYEQEIFDTVTLPVSLPTSQKGIRL